MTIIDCGSDILRVPTEEVKSQLRLAKKLSQVDIHEEDSLEVVNQKIVKTFPHLENEEIVFLSATISGHLQ